MTGFVVVDGHGNVYALSADRLLWIPTYRGRATLFTNRQNARRAIHRTNQYGRRMGLGWAEDMRVMRVTMEAP